MNIDDLYYYWNSKSYHRLDEITNILEGEISC